MVNVSPLIGASPSPRRMEATKTNFIFSGFTGSVKETVEAVAMIKNLYIYGVILAWGLIAICMLAYHLDKEYDQVLAELK